MAITKKESRNKHICGIRALQRTVFFKIFEKTQPI